MNSVYKNIVLFLYIILIFSISSIPGNGFIGKIHQFGIDKIFHFFEYLILGSLLVLAVNKKSNIFKIFYILVLSIAYLDEYFVQDISGRTVDHLDFLFNLLGLYTGIFISILATNYYDKKNKN